MLSFSQFKDLFNELIGQYEICFNDGQTIIVNNEDGKFVIEYESCGEITLDMASTGLDDIIINRKNLESLWPTVEDVIFDEVFSIKNDLADIVDIAGLSFDWYYLDFPDFVKATEDIEYDGKIIQKDTKGTIVHVYNEGEAFEVEFVDDNKKTIDVVLCYPHQLKIWIKYSL